MKATSIRHRPGRAAWLVAIWTLALASCAHIGQPVEGPVGPSAPALGTRVFVQGDRGQTVESLSFDVPTAGEAVLRVVNAAKAGSAPSERVLGTEITLNGDVVVNATSFNDKTDVLQIRVRLCEGTNRLLVKLTAQPGQRLALRIDVPADKIVVAPPLNAAVLGGEAMQARATVTGLGLPVPGAQVQFEVRGLGQPIQRNATTSNTGIASTYFTGFGAGSGQLSATLSSRLTASVPVTVVNKRILSVTQRPESLRLEAGATQSFSLAMDLRGSVSDQDILTLDHVVRPDQAGTLPAGLVVRSYFPPKGQAVPASKPISVSPTVTAVAPGRYTVTTVATVTEKATGNVRDSFKTELSAEVVVPGTPPPLVLSKPLIAPSGTAPTPGRVEVTFQTSILGISRRPAVVFLDRVTSSGELISEEIELRDDGKTPDARAQDGFYAGRLELGGEEETEIYFRLRTEHSGKTVTSDVAVFPITRLRLGSRPSTSPLVDNSTGKSKVFANEVIVGTLAGVSPRRMRTIVDEVGKDLGLSAGSIGIAGYLPWADVYLVEFKGNGTLEGVNQAISAFSVYLEVKYTSPNGQGRLASSEWFLDHIGIDRLRLSSARGLPEIYGDSDVGIAIIDTAVNCNHPDLQGKCADMSAIPADCQGIYGNAGGTTNHGTRVAALAAGRGSASGILGIEGGVAWNAQLFPFVLPSASFTDADHAIHCGLTQPGAKVVNMSMEFVDDDLTLETAVCDAVCANRLFVAAAGNYACPQGTGFTDIFPGAYSKKATSCNCTTPIASRVLSVGGTDNIDARGGICGPTVFLKSQLGEIYAPGWGISFSDPPADPIGTSWSAPLVSGCAALRGALEVARKPDGWDPTKLKTRLVTTAKDLPPDGELLPSGDPAPFKLLDCHAAFSEPYDLVFVLDRSGSMGTPTASGISRWTALTNAVNSFALLMRQNPPLDSRIGITVFASDVVQDLPAPLQLVPIVDSSVPSILSTALNQAPSGATAMGKGLHAGLKKLTDTSKKQQRVVVLFTDGEQNIHPFLDLSGCRFEDTDPTSNPSYLCEPPPPPNAVDPPIRTRIIAVGVGNPSGDYLTTLQNLATANGGKFIATDAVQSSNPDSCTQSLDRVFDCIVAPALYGYSPQMVASHSGTLGGTVTLPAFDLNKYVSQLLIKLSFSRSFDTSELSSILSGVRITRNGVDVTKIFEPVFPTAFTNSILLKTDFHPQKAKTTAGPAEGSYQVHLTARPEHVGLGVSAVIYADDHLFDMDWQVSPIAPRVNQPFSPTVWLKWRGKPVTNAKVEVRISQPGDDVSDLLAKHPQKVDPTSRPDAGSPGYQKYAFLLENDPKFMAQLRARDQAFVLAHKGGGQYEAPYNPGTISGTYQISYRVSVEDPQFGKIERIAVQTVYVRFGDVDLSKSAVTTVVGSNTVTVNFRPITTYGRFIGPAQGRAFSIVGEGIKVSNLTDHQDGSYTFVLVARSDTQLSMKLLGQEIYQGPAAFIDRRKCCGK